MYSAFNANLIFFLSRRNAKELAAAGKESYQTQALILLLILLIVGILATSSMSTFFYSNFR